MRHNMKIYIAGKMRGIPEYNYPLFNKVDDILTEMGHDVVNPAKLQEDTTLSFEAYMKVDLPALMSCEAIGVLDGWQDSVGGNRELIVATAIGLATYQIKFFNDNF